jgi:polyphosphate kinase
VRSVIGRYLEHSRILYFRWGESAEEEALFLSSADWMGRNMFRRIEVAWPVRDARLRQRVIDECLVPYLHDNADAWVQLGDGSYERVRATKPDAAGVPPGTSAQQVLMNYFAPGA